MSTPVASAKIRISWPGLTAIFIGILFAMTRECVPVATAVPKAPPAILKTPRSIPGPSNRNKNAPCPAASLLDTPDTYAARKNVIPPGTSNGPGAVCDPRVVNCVLVSTAISAPSLLLNNFGIFFCYYNFLLSNFYRV